jgi:hypothetical protein
MMKSLYFQFSVGVVPLYMVTFAGYWAYGSSTDAYLLNNVNGPVWVKALANITAFLQSVIALHVHKSKLELLLNLNVLIKLCLTRLITPCSASVRYLQVQCMSIWIQKTRSKEVH